MITHLSKDIQRIMITQIPIGPKNGTINTVIHISDIHIRNGNKNQNRFDEYHGVFRNLFDKIQNRNNEYSVCVITGDIFHNKSKIESSGIMLFNDFLNKLSKLIPVYIIQGNHDYRQDEPNEPDMLTAFLGKNTIENVFYMNKTGLYQFEDVVFGVVAIDDVLIKGDTSGHVEDLPLFPNWFPSDKVIKIALFHGTICNCTLQNFTNSTTGYPLQWFKEYDYGMFGDIHLQQIHWSNKYNLKWGYSGSLLQQNYGETINNHGFIEWNIRDNTETFYQIHNDFVLMYLSKINNDWIITNITPRQPFTSYLQNLNHNSNTHTHITIKIINDYNNDDIAWLKNVIDRYPRCICTLHFDMRSKNIDTKYEETTTWDEQNVHYNTQDYVIQFIDEKKYTILEENRQEWINCIRFPENLCIEMDINKIPDGIRKKIQDKNDYVTKLINSGEDITWDSDCKKKNVLTLDKIQWQWLLCYGGNNSFDFEKASNECILINGKNGVGKSSFYEIVYLSIFGTSIPSRTNSSRSSDIICVNKPDNDTAKTVLYFKLNDDVYKLQRCFKYQIDKTKLQKVNIKLTRYNETSGSYEQYKSGSAVDTWIRKEIGQPESFLLSSMVSQNTDEDFFLKKPSDQFEILDRAMNMNKINNIINLYKHISLGYSSIIDSIDSVYSDYINRNELSTSILIQELKELKDDFTLYNNEYDVLEIRKRDIYTKIMTESDHYSVFYDLSDVELSAKIDALKDKYKCDTSKLTEYENELYEDKKNIQRLQEKYNSVFSIDLNENEICRRHNGMVCLLEDEPVSRSSFNRLMQIEQKILNTFGHMVHSSEVLERGKNIERQIHRISTKLSTLFSNKDMFAKQIEILISTKPDTHRYDDKSHADRTRSYDNLIKDINERYSSVDELEELVKHIHVDSTYNLLSCDDFAILEQDILNAHEYYKLTQNKFEETQRSCNCHKEKIEKEYSDLLKEQHLLNKRNYTHKTKFEKIQNKWIASYNDMIECTKPINQYDKKIYVKQMKKHDLDRGILDDNMKTYEKMREKIEYYTTMQADTNAKRTQISEFQEKLMMLSKCEYNNECWACVKNPCKLEKDAIMYSMDNLRNHIDDNERQLSCSNVELESLNQEIFRLKLWLDEYDEIENKYSTMMRSVEEFDKMQSIVNMHARHNKTKLSVQEELETIDRLSKDIQMKISDRLTELNEIKDQQQILQHTTYIVWQKKFTKYEKECREMTLRRDHKIELDLYKQLETFRVNQDEWSSDYDLLMKNIKWCDDLKIIHDELKHVNDEIYQKNVDMKEKESELSENEKWVELITEYETSNEDYTKYKKEMDMYCKNNITWFLDKNRVLEERIKLCQMQNCHRNRIYKQECESIEYKVSIVKTKLEELRILIDRKNIEKEKQSKIETIIHDYGDFLKLLTNKKNIIDTIKISLHEYRWWIYDNKMLKELLKETNNVITMMTGNQDVKLDGTINKSVKHVFTFDWRLNCNGNVICIEKSSGFQRFVIGLGMRIALSRIGATHIKCAQLFIDEGFNSCDNVHLKKVSQFLENVISIYKCVILVSHLEDIRESVSRVIEIEQKLYDRNKISQITF